MHHMKHQSPNSSRLERWLGPVMVEELSRSMKGWYGPPIPVANVPGKVLVHGDGSFSGMSLHGAAGVLAEFTIDKMKRLEKASRSPRIMNTSHTGFSSLGDLISEASVGKKQHMLFTKTGPTKTVGRGAELFFRAQFPVPTAEGTGEGGAAGTGRILTRTTQGALRQADPTGGDTLHFVSAMVQGNVGTNCLMLYDRLWDMSHVLTVDPRSCDAVNVPARYQTSPLAPGNFLSGDVAVVLPAASNTAAFDYVNHGGGNATTPAVNLLTGAVVGTIVLSTPNWFVPLAAGDVGIRSLQSSSTAVNLSAAYASGEVTWFIGHPIAMLPVAIANFPVFIDGINGNFQLSEVMTDACLAFLEMPTGTVTATSYWGQVILVSG